MNGMRGTADRESGALDSYIKQYEHDPGYLAEAMALVLMEEAAHLMEAQGMSRAQLAQRMGVSRAHVSRLFNAPPNLTLQSIARLAVALGVKPFIRMVSPEKMRQESAVSPGR